MPTARRGASKPPKDRGAGAPPGPKGQPRGGLRSRPGGGDQGGLNIVLKADVAGSLEALQDEIAKVPQEQVGINIIHSQTGGINESDVTLASASNA